MELTPILIVLILSIGLGIGTVSGMVGIGGGVLVIPTLIFFFGFTQVKANGTSLAMLLPPIGIFAVMTYWKAGNIDWPVAMLLAVGFAVGAVLGAKAVNSGLINPDALRICFAFLLIYCAGRILFNRSDPARAAIETVLLVSTFFIIYVSGRLLGKTWSDLPKPTDIYRAKERASQAYDYEI